MEWLRDLVPHEIWSDASRMSWDYGFVVAAVIIFSIAVICLIPWGNGIIFSSMLLPSHPIDRRACLTLSATFGCFFSLLGFLFLCLAAHSGPPLHFHAYNISRTTVDLDACLNVGPGFGSVQECIIEPSIVVSSQRQCEVKLQEPVLGMRLKLRLLENATFSRLENAHFVMTFDALCCQQRHAIPLAVHLWTSSSIVFFNQLDSSRKEYFSSILPPQSLSHHHASVRHEMHTLAVFVHPHGRAQHHTVALFVNDWLIVDGSGQLPYVHEQGCEFCHNLTLSNFSFRMEGHIDAMIALYAVDPLGDQSGVWKLSFPGKLYVILVAAVAVLYLCVRAFSSAKKHGQRVLAHLRNVWGTTDETAVLQPKFRRD